MPRKSQIEAWKAKAQDACEEIVLSVDRNIQRPRIPTTAERRRTAIVKVKNDFITFACSRLTDPRIEISKLLVNGKEAGIGFIAIDRKNRHMKIVRSHFFGPKGY